MCSFPISRALQQRGLLPTVGISFSSQCGAVVLCLVPEKILLYLIFNILGGSVMMQTRIRSCSK